MFICVWCVFFFRRGERYLCFFVLAGGVVVNRRRCLSGCGAYWCVRVCVGGGGGGKPVVCSYVAYATRNLCAVM